MQTVAVKRGSDLECWKKQKRSKLSKKKNSGSSRTSLLHWPLVLQIKETICYGMVFIFIISTEFFCWFVDLVRRGEDENKTTDPNHMFRLPTELENTNGMRFYYIPSKITITLMYNWKLSHFFIAEILEARGGFGLS